MKDPSATNRISRYDAAEWLAMLVGSRLIDYGEPVVATHESMMNSPEICKFDDDASDEMP